MIEKEGVARKKRERDRERKNRYQKVKRFFKRKNQENTY